MAKTKAKGSPAKASEPAGKTVAFRVSGPYAEWLDQVAEKNQTNVTALLAQALARYADGLGMGSPPKR